MERQQASTTMTPQELKSRIAILQEEIAAAKAKLSALENSDTYVSFGQTVEMPVGHVVPSSIEDYDIVAAIAQCINEKKLFNLVGQIKVWVNGDLETVRDFFVTENRELICTPY